MPVEVDAWRSMLLDKNAFLENVMDGMVGWLDRYAAKRTLDLLDFQEKSGIDGSLYEIGLYHGKYFSLLARSAAITGSKLVGVDLFQMISRENFQEYFCDKFDPASLAEITNFRWTVLEGSSGDISPTRLLAELGSEARFISVDGSHEYEDVLWDMRVAEQMLAPNGIISADDFLHPISLGVTAAIYEFVYTNPSLVPFAHVSNKLFLCRSGWADRYRSCVEAAVLADEAEPKSQAFRQSFNAGHRRNIEASFRGYRILTIRL